MILLAFLSYLCYKLKLIESIEREGSVKMANFKKGDIVSHKTVTKWKKGIIVGSGKLMGKGYKVRWDNGEAKMCKEEELELMNS